MKVLVNVYLRMANTKQINSRLKKLKTLLQF